MRCRRQPATRWPGRLTGANQYTVWNTDSNGNFVSDTLGVVSGTSYALESLETSFQQDLNGDGTIGPTTTVIESAGSTSLTQVADQVYLYNSGGSRPCAAVCEYTLGRGSIRRLDADRCRADRNRV